LIKRYFITTLPLFPCRHVAGFSKMVAEKQQGISRKAAGKIDALIG
jgi:hypothetical protein